MERINLAVSIGWVVVIRILVRRFGQTLSIVNLLLGHRENLYAGCCANNGKAHLKYSHVSVFGLKPPVWGYLWRSRPSQHSGVRYLQAVTGQVHLIRRAVYTWGCECSVFCAATALSAVHYCLCKYLRQCWRNNRWHRLIENKALLTQRGYYCTGRKSDKGVIKFKFRSLILSALLLTWPDFLEHLNFECAWEVNLILVSILEFSVRASSPQSIQDENTVSNIRFVSGGIKTP